MKRRVKLRQPLNSLEGYNKDNKDGYPSSLPQLYLVLKQKIPAIQMEQLALSFSS